MYLLDYVNMEVSIVKLDVIKDLLYVISKILFRHGRKMEPM